MKPIIRQFTKFNVGMNPDLYSEGLTRVEHFDTVTPQARPFRELAAITMLNSLTKLVKFTRGINNRIYSLGLTSTTPTVGMWNLATGMEGFQAFDSASTAAEVIHFYKGHIYGLWKGTSLWKVECSANGATSLSFTAAFKSISYTNYCDPITHSKDGLMYIAVDNLIYSFDGTTLSAALLTLPSTFVITSIAEQGDFINIVGYDSQKSTGVSFVWDRDSSLTTLTSKYELGTQTPKHNATIGGTPFIISLRDASANSEFTETKSLIIRYLNGDKYSILKEYFFTTITIGGKYADNGKLYFNAFIQPITEAAGHYVTFQLDERGILSIAQNVGINDAGARKDTPGIIRDSQTFFIGGGVDGQWKTKDTWATTSAIETFRDSSVNILNSIDFVNAGVNFEPLTSGQTVSILTRIDSETAWTTIKTFSTVGTQGGTVVGQELIALGKDINSQIRQFRLESTGGAVIIGFQYQLEEKDDGSSS